MNEVTISPRLQEALAEYMNVVTLEYPFSSEVQRQSKSILSQLESCFSSERLKVLNLLWDNTLQDEDSDKALEQLLRIAPIVQLRTNFAGTHPERVQEWAHIRKHIGLAPIQLALTAVPAAAIEVVNAWIDLVKEGVVGLTIVFSAVAEKEELIEANRILYDAGISCRVEDSAECMTSVRELYLNEMSFCKNVITPYICSDATVWSCGKKAIETDVARKMSPLYLGSLLEEPLANLLKHQLERPQLLLTLLMGPFAMLLGLSQENEALKEILTEEELTLVRHVQHCSECDQPVQSSQSFWHRISLGKRISDRIAPQGCSVEQDVSSPEITTMCDFCRIVNKQNFPELSSLFADEKTLDAAYHLWLNIVSLDYVKKSVDNPIVVN